MIRRVAFSFIFIALGLTYAVHSTAQSARDYAVEPRISAAAFSPDGKILALGMAYEDAKEIKLIELDGIMAVTSTSINLNFSRSAREEILWLGWAGDDNLLMYVTAIDGGIKNRPIGMARLVRISRDGQKLKDLGRLPGLSLRGTGKRTYGSGIISLLPKEPDHILMGVGSAGATKLNVKTGTVELLHRGSQKTPSWTPDLRGEVRVNQGRKIGTDTYYFNIRDADSSTWRDFSEYKGLANDERVVGFTSNPNELVIARFRIHGTLEFLVYDLAEQAVVRTMFSDPQYDAESLIYNSTYDEVIGVQYIADAPQIRYLKETAPTAIEMASRKFPDTNITLLSQDRSGKKSVFRASSPSTPGIVFLFDKATGEHKVLAADYPALGNLRHGPVSTVSYKASDGTTIPGYLTLPPKTTSGASSEALPFIVLPHGGPYSRYYADFDWLSQFLVSRGYGVLKMNFRGSTGYGQSFMEQGRDDWGLMLSDVNDGAKWLVAEGLADPERICILGWSFGGFLAQTAASDAPENYQCAVSINGVSNWARMRSFNDEEFWGELNESNTKKVKASPYSKVDEVSLPLYLGHAELDTVVPFTQFKTFKSKLKKAKKDFVAHNFEDADHDIGDVKNRTALLISIDEFLVEHLGESEWAND